MLTYLPILGAIISLFGIYFYAKETIKGNTKPNRVTWLMWSIAPLIGSAAAFSQGIGWATLPVFMAGFGPLVVLLASFVNKNSYWELTKFDYLCGLFSILALVLWAVTRDANVAILFAIMSDASAAIPTLIKGWREPETESVEAYSTGLISAITSFGAMRSFMFAELAFPLYLVVMNILLIFVVIRKKLGISILK